MNVLRLRQNEMIRVDRDRLRGLYRQLGPTSAQDVLCRAIEELAVRLAHCEHLWQEERWTDMRKCARSMIAISEQIGLTTLSRVAQDVTHALDGCDLPAVGATMCRLMRIGERSLTEIWDQYDA